MSPELLGTEAAIAAVRKIGLGKSVISNVDGFRVVPEGYMEDVDLLFLPCGTPSAAEAADQAENFIRKNGGDDVVWEIWAE